MNPARRVVVAMMGRPASGKSTLARQLVQSLEGTLISTCAIKQSLKPDFDTRDCFDENLRLTAYREAARLCQSALAEGGLPIVDAGFHSRLLRAGLVELARAARAELSWVYCACLDSCEILKRITRRARAPGTCDDQSNAPEVFEYLNARFEEPLPAEFPSWTTLVYIRTDLSEAEPEISLSLAGRIIRKNRKYGALDYRPL